MIKHITGSVLFCVVVMIAFWLRIPSVERLPAEQFTETDGYFYYWQASLISEHGLLPARDMHRWLPIGRDLGQTLNLYGYVLAYTHKALAGVFPNISLYHVSLYMPVVCFCLGMGTLCIFLLHAYGWLFSITVGLILATLPGSIERSTVGFGDRDAWCLMIGTLTVITYLMSLRAELPRHRILWTLVSGFIVFLGGLSWEGFGVFLSIILVVELWRFLSTETEEGLRYYLLWVFCFVPTLYAASTAYRNGYGFAEHLAAFVLVPSVVLLGMRALRYLLISKVDACCRAARNLSFGITLVSFTLGIGYILIQQQTFESTTVPLSQSTLMQVMTELRSPHYWYWVYRYGFFFIFGSIGFVVLAFSRWRRHGIFLSIALVGFTGFTFFREQSDRVWGVPFGNVLFGIALVGCAVGLLWLGWREQTQAKNDNTVIACIAWFIFWTALARDAKRYDFFIGVPLAFGTAALIQTITAALSEKLHRWYAADELRQGFTPIQFKTGTAVILLILLMGLPTQYTHTYRAFYTAEKMRAVTPSGQVAKAMFWMQNELPRTAVVAAHWAYGSQLNVLAGVKTITDQDTYLQHWVLLYNKHVHKAKDEHEALTFLKTHSATHIMLTKKDPKNTLLRGQLSETFRPVYPKDKFADAEVKVWEIHYPSYIKIDRKYLETGFHEIDAHLNPK